MVQKILLWYRRSDDAWGDVNSGIVIKTSTQIPIKTSLEILLSHTLLFSSLEIPFSSDEGCFTNKMPFCGSYQ